MKRFITIVSLAIISLPHSLSADNTTETTSTELSANQDQELLSQKEIAKLDKIANELKANKEQKVQIISSSDAKGADCSENRFAYIKALYVSDWFKNQKLNAEQISFVGAALDSSITGYTKERKVSIFTGASDEEFASAFASNDTTKSETTAEAKSRECGEIYLRTNLLYFAGGLINIGAEYRMSDFGFLLNAGYSPLSSDSWDKNLGGWFVSPEVRYYIPKNDSWFVGAQILYGGYDLKISKSLHGREGNVLGVGAMGGYKIALSKNFDMDFTLGLGYAKLDYDSYETVDGKRAYSDMGITKNTFLPIQGGINLIYKIK